MTGYVSETVHAGATRGGDLGHGKMSSSRAATTR
jgi:hypothetical protein